MILRLHCVCFAVVLTSISTSQAGLLDNATLNMMPVPARDVVYDSPRGLVYASVPSAAGVPYGNSIVRVAPHTLSIVGHTFVGSEPNKLAISSDASRVYVGIDGARAFTWWQPTNNTVGSLVPVKSVFGNPAVVQSMAVSPTNPHVVVVSKDDVSNTASGDLEFFQNSSSLGVATPTYPYNDANELGFIDDNTLISYNNSDTSYTLARWNFTGAALSRQGGVNGLISGFSTHMETNGGLIYSSTGMVVNPASLSALGTFVVPSNSAVEAIGSENITYFLGPNSTSDRTLTLRVFDNQSFLMLQSKSFPQFVLSGSVQQLVRAGDNGLAFVTSSGQFGIINAVPEPSTVTLFALAVPGLLLIWRRRSRRQ